MPEEYRDLYANIKCRDCLQTSLASFHILGRFYNWEVGEAGFLRSKVQKNFFFEREVVLSFIQTDKQKDIVILESIYYS